MLIVTTGSEPPPLPGSAPPTKAGRRPMVIGSEQLARLTKRAGLRSKLITVGVVGVVIVLAVFAGALPSSSSNEITSVRVIETETDAAGRLTASTVEVSFNVTVTEKHTEQCSIEFFDVDQQQLVAPNSTEVAAAPRDRDDENVNTETYRYTRRISVPGVPHTARVRC